MIIKEFRTYDTPKIKSMIIRLKSSLLKNRFKLAQGELTNTDIFHKTRRTIAQLFTVLTERNETLTDKDWKLYSSAITQDE